MGEVHSRSYRAIPDRFADSGIVPRLVVCVMMRMEISGGPGGAAGPVRAPTMTQPKLSVVSPSELPDYQPAFQAMSARADASGNIWIRTIPTKPQPAGTAYDVINAKGEVVERVLVPEKRTIIGFGPDNVVYLVAIEDGKISLERARVK